MTAQQKISDRDRVECFSASGGLEAVFWGYSCPEISVLKEHFHSIIVKSSRGRVKFDIQSRA